MKGSVATAFVSEEKRQRKPCNGHRRSAGVAQRLMLARSQQRRLRKRGGDAGVVQHDHRPAGGRRGLRWILFHKRLRTGGGQMALVGVVWDQPTGVGAGAAGGRRTANSSSSWPAYFSRRPGTCRRVWRGRLFGWDSTERRMDQSAELEKMLPQRGDGRGGAEGGRGGREGRGG